MAPQGTLAEREAPLRDADFKRIAALVHAMAGIVLPENKRPLVQSRLTRRLRALGLSDFSVYADFVSQAENVSERRELVTAVTTNVTSFFRERHHFEALTQTIFPNLTARLRSGGRVRIWSAGCSSGEEAYTIAACLLAALPEAGRLDVRILATDIDRTMVEKARNARYPAEVVASLPRDHARRLFPAPADAGMVQIADPVRALVSCKLLNLQDEWPMRGKFDIIFCRNVVIYFDKDTQEALWQRFAGLLPQGGYLMIGHSERVSGPALAEFATDGLTTYARR